MNAQETKKFSKFLSLILRHRPEIIGLTLDKEGWADIAELIAKSQSRQVALDEEKLRYVVAHNDKQRFSFSADGRRIRANQGHSLKVNLGWVVKTPPDTLYHGTATRNLPSIRAQGLLRRNRHHVHLSADEETARSVGRRYGKPVVLKIRAGQMHREGIKFYQSKNGVWLTDQVANHYIAFDD